jgi:DNA polymerase-3 subunit gamma/tau
MDYQVSARKYRPGTFDDVIGQPHVVQTLMNAIESKRVAQAYLFSGTRGVGKTTVARILAKALNCERGPTGSPCAVCANCLEIAQGNSVDVIEIDGASNTSVDDVREIRENVKFAPFRGQYRIYIIDEVHMLSNSAFNALLKTLEEPPGHVVFIFATTEIHKIPATILSRCQHYNFRRIARTEIVDRLRYVAAQDGMTIEERSFAALARASEGSMRDALSLLDQAMAFGGKTIIHADLELLLGAIPQELVRTMIQALIVQDSAAALHALSTLLDGGHDLRAYCAEIVEYLRNMLVVSVTAQHEWPRLIEASSEDLAQFASDAGSFSPEELQQLFAIFAQAEDGLRGSAHPRFVLETASVSATRLFRKGEGSTVQPARPLAPERPAVPAMPRMEKRTGPVPRTAPVSSPAPQVSVTAKAPASQNRSTQTEPKTEASAAAPADATNTKEAAVRPPAGTHTGPPPDGGGVALRWEQFQDEVGLTFPNVAPFLERGRLVGIEGNVITVGFDKQATVARAMLEKPDNIQALTALCARLSGQPMRLRIVELTEENPAGPTMAQIRAAKEQEQRLVLFERARAHPVVKRALEIFGAELTDVRPVTQQKEVRE